MAIELWTAAHFEGVPVEKYRKVDDQLDLFIAQQLINFISVLRPTSVFEDVTPDAWMFSDIEARIKVHAQNSATLKFSQKEGQFHVELFKLSQGLLIPRNQELTIDIPGIEPICVLAGQPEYDPQVSLFGFIQHTPEMMLPKAFETERKVKIPTAA